MDNRVTIVQDLIKAGADVNSQTNNGITGLIYGKLIYSFFYLNLFYY